MNEYNKRILKNVLEDVREENDLLFFEEIEAAANDVNFANNADRDSEIFKALNENIVNSKNAHRRKILVQVASIILALLIGISVMTVSVKGLYEKLWEFLSNIGNPSYSLIVTSDNGDENSLLGYRGQYIPTWIPDGYKIVSVDNNDSCCTIEIKNKSGNLISFSEYFKADKTKFNLDKENFDKYEEHTINGKYIILAAKNNITTVVVKESDAIIHILFDDNEIDCLSFAKMIEKK